MPTMKRDDYKAIKHMDKAQLTFYLQRVYQRGYEAGLKAVTNPVEKVSAPDHMETTEG